MFIKNRTVLHVDDDLAATRLTHALLRSYGIQTVALNDPSQLIERLLNDQHHVVLLDIEMPHHDGLEILRDIKRLDGGITVIMLTAMVSQSTVLQSLRRGAAGCFFKPIVDPEPLVRAIAEAFDNLERWWRTLQELSVLRRQDENTLRSFEVANGGQQPLDPRGPTGNFAS
jgi:CheY-like chemotaxis protein